MQHLTKTIAIIGLSVLLFSGINFAQSSEQPLLVVSQNQVPMQDMGKLNKLGDSLFVPILKELVDEGMILSFGQFVHSWGDEWNVNYWYTTKDMASFEKFWSEYVKRVSSRHPGAFGQAVKYFTAHKDNIYRIRGQYPAPPQSK